MTGKHARGCVAREGETGVEAAGGGGEGEREGRWGGGGEGFTASAWMRFLGDDAMAASAHAAGVCACAPLCVPAFGKALGTSRL